MSGQNQTRIYWDKSVTGPGRRALASWVRSNTGIPLHEAHEISLRGWIDLGEVDALGMLEDFEWSSFEPYPEPPPNPDNLLTPLIGGGR